MSVFLVVLPVFAYLHVPQTKYSISRPLGTNAITKASGFEREMYCMIRYSVRYTLHYTWSYIISFYLTLFTYPYHLLSPTYVKSLYFPLSFNYGLFILSCLNNTSHFLILHCFSLPQHYLRRTCLNSLIAILNKVPVVRTL